MNMRLLQITFLCLAGVLSMVSCEKKFNEMNIDPNRPKEATPGVLLGQLEYQIVNNRMWDARDLTHELMQVQASRSNANANSIMRWFIGPKDGIWQSYYKRLTDANDLYAIAEKVQEPNYKAIAIVCQAYIFSILTDLYGDVPFTEANQGGTGNFSPAFDRQKDIYKQLLQKLEEANTLFDGSKALSYGGDMLYYGHTAAGNMIKWKKFCNSLRLRFLLRLIKRDGELPISAEINAILSDPEQYPVFSSNADEAIFRYTGAYPYFNPFFNSRTLDWRDGTYFTSFFLDKMNQDKDPRRAVWARTIKVDGADVYRGIKSGYPVGEEYDVNANSNYTDALKTLPQLGIIMTYAELEFIKAELALKGFPTESSAAEHYNKGITASMKQWGVSLPDGYVEQKGVQYALDATTEEQLEQIIVQKYYALFFTDYQSWFEKRRTGYPTLPRGEGIPAGRVFPRRTPYPLYLQSLNASNLSDAVSHMGGDDCYTRVWWDKP